MNLTPANLKLSLGKIAITAVAVATIVYGIAEFRGPSGYEGLMHKREEVRQLELENQKLRDEVDRLGKRVDSLKNDTSAQELEIRKRSGKVKSGEVVYLTQGSSHSGAAKTPAVPAPSH